MNKFIITIPDLAAAKKLLGYMGECNAVHQLGAVNELSFPSRVVIPIPSAAHAVKAYLLIHQYTNETQIKRLEGLILDAGLKLPIPKLESTDGIERLAGLDRQMRNLLRREGIHTIAALISLSSTGLKAIPKIGTEERQQQLIDCVHAHRFRFSDEE